MNKTNWKMEAGLMVRDAATGKAYYFASRKEFYAAQHVPSSLEPAAWDPKDSARAVYDTKTHEITWLDQKEGLSPQGMVMAAPLGKYALMPAAEPYQVV